MMKRTLAFISGLLLLVSCGADKGFDVLIGTFGDNMYSAVFAGGELKGITPVPAKDPAFIINGESGYYAVSENKETPGAYTFSEGLETNSYCAEGVAFSPCNIIRPQGGSTLLISSYADGVISVLGLDGEDRITGVEGTLSFEGRGPAGEQQEHARIHQVIQLDEDWLLASDLGSDRIRILRNNGGHPVHTGDFELPAGCGPRHMEHVPGSPFIYLVTEISREVMTLKLDMDRGMPELSLLQSLKADGSTVSGGGDIHLHPDGKWLYASMRNDNDGIAVFKVLEDGTLEYSDYTRSAEHPRHFSISPDGRYMLVACVNAACVEIFPIGRDGKLQKERSRTVSFAPDKPSCIRFR